MPLGTLHKPLRTSPSWVREGLCTGYTPFMLGLKDTRPQCRSSGSRHRYAFRAAAERAAAHLRTPSPRASLAPSHTPSPPALAPPPPPPPPAAACVGAGYGDFTPSSHSEKMFLCLMAFLSVCPRAASVVPPPPRRLRGASASAVRVPRAPAEAPCVPPRVSGWGCDPICCVMYSEGGIRNRHGGGGGRLLSSGTRPPPPPPCPPGPFSYQGSIAASHTTLPLQCPPHPQGPSAHFYWGGGGRVAYKSEETPPPPGNRRTLERQNLEQTTVCQAVPRHLKARNHLSDRSLIGEGGGGGGARADPMSDVMLNRWTGGFASRNRVAAGPRGMPLGSRCCCGGLLSKGGGGGAEVWGQPKPSNDPRNNQHNRQYANCSAPLTRKRHIPPHPAQPRHTNYWAPRTRKRHPQEHRPQRPTERSDPTQHAKGRPGDCPGPRKGATTGRNVTQGGGGGIKAEGVRRLDPVHNNC